MTNIDYRKGAFKALLNAKNWIEFHSMDLNYDRIKAVDFASILSVFIENLDEFMDCGDHFEISHKKDAKNKRIFYRAPKKNR